MIRQAHRRRTGFAKPELWERQRVSSAEKQSTFHLVAPELAPGLENFPSMDFTVPLKEIRAGFSNREMPPMPAGLEQVQVEDRTIPGPAGAPDVRVLIYTPPGETDGKRPAVCHIHGGGYVIGRADIGDIPNRAMALAVGCVIVSVDYRKAPETRWPGARDDCYAALTWMRDNADALGIDGGQAVSEVDPVDQSRRA